jgi:small subunit ribosomal protein S16
MPTKIRLQRHGKKRYAYYHVVVADARAPRDGKFIEKLGTYNPNENPARIDISFERSLHWVKEGAQPTDTVRALLSYKGVMHKDHLDRGVTKGALTQEQADKKFEAWLTEKESKVDGKKDGLAKAADADVKARLAAETEIKNKRAAEVLAKQSELAAAVEAEAAEKAAIKAAAAAEKAALANPVKEAAPVVEAAPAAEAPAAEAAPEATEAPATEDKKED